MNILHHKSWHVRTKRNIERVRKDEEKAAEEEKEQQRRISLAEQEARIDLLRSKRKSSNDLGETSKPKHEAKTFTPGEHINFFEGAEESSRTGDNKEHIAEKKAEKEKQEMNIGLLTYLGQGSVETQQSKPWYFKDRDQDKETEDASSKSMGRLEVDKNKKRLHDPMSSINKYLEKKHKHKKHKKDKDKQVSTHKRPVGPRIASSSKTLEQLRAERVQREHGERKRTEELMARRFGGATDVKEDVEMDERKRKYNSGFNPDFTRKPQVKRDWEHFK